MFVLDVLWSIVGFYGDISKLLSYLYALPVLLFALGASVFLAKCQKHKK